MIKVNWTIEEAVALFDLYYKHDNYLNITDNEIDSLSGILKRRASILGIETDEKYRNRHGLRMQLAGIHYIVSDGKEGIRNVGKVFRDVYKLYTLIPDVYKEILNDFYAKYR